MSPRRVYFLTHPFIFFFGLAIFLAGLELTTFALDPPLSYLPAWIRAVWHLIYTVGGLSLALGIVYRNPALEGVGLNMVGGAFLAQTWLSIEQGPLNLSAPGATFLLVLAVGLFFRFGVLLKYMNKNVTLPSDLLASMAEPDEPNRSG